MKPVDQTTFGVPGGNCLSACIASLLHLSITEVPYLESDELETQLEKFGAWLKDRGIYPLVLSAGAQIPGYYILHGRSPRGRGTHAVIAVGNTIVHDPHPSRKGILEVTKKTVLVPYEPQKVVVA